MNTSMENQIKVKMFVGFLLNSEIRMHLNQSALWKQATIDSKTALIPMKEVSYQGKSYIGEFTTTDRITLQELQEIEIQMQNVMAEYCPELNAENLKIQVFSQIFIS